MQSDRDWRQGAKERYGQGSPEQAAGPGRAEKEKTTATDPGDR